MEVRRGKEGGKEREGGREVRRGREGGKEREGGKGRALKPVKMGHLNITNCLYTG